MLGLDAIFMLGWMLYAIEITSLHHVQEILTNGRECRVESLVEQVTTT